MPEPETPLTETSAQPSATVDDTLLESHAAELRVALFRFTRKLRQQRGDNDLPDAQHTVLTALAKHGPLTPGALADRENVRPPSMTRTVNALAELGLVHKAGNPDDGRQVVVELTDAGHREVVETRRRRDAWLSAQLENLDDPDRVTLYRAAEILLEVAGR